MILTIRSRASNLSIPSSRENATAGIDAVAMVPSGHDYGHGQLVPHANLEIVRVVRGRDFHHAGSELWIDIFVGDDWNLDVGNRQQHRFPNEPLVAFIVRVNGNCDVAEHCLRAGGRDRQGRLVLRAGYLVGDVVKVPHLFAVLCFLVAQRCEAARAPVDHAMSAIDQAFLVQAHERLAHGAESSGESV